MRPRPALATWTGRGASRAALNLGALCGSQTALGQSRPCRAASCQTNGDIAFRTACARVSSTFARYWL